jgi:hypothetical protein
MATYRTSAAGGSTSGTGNRTVAVTTAIGDLLVVFCAASGNTNVTPTCTDNRGGTYTRVDAALFGASANAMSVFVADQLAASAVSTTITVATGSNTAAELVAVAVSGMTRTSANGAIRGSGSQANQAAGTPAPALGAAALTANVTIGCVANSTSPAGMTAPTGWTERQDVGQATPSTGLEVVTRNSGFTGTTVTWGSASATPFASFVLELDGSAGPVSGSGSGVLASLAGGGSAIVRFRSDAPEVDPTTLAFTGLFLSSYAPPKWKGAPSAGTSGGHDLTSASAATLQSVLGSRLALYFEGKNYNAATGVWTPSVGTDTLVQSTAGKRPGTGTTPTNGNPTLTLDGVDDELNTADNATSHFTGLGALPAVGTGQRMFCCVVMAPAGTGDRPIVYYSSEAFGIDPYAGGDDHFRCLTAYPSTDAVSNAVGDDGAWHRLILVGDDASRVGKMYVDGVLQTTTAANTTTGFGDPSEWGCYGAGVFGDARGSVFKGAGSEFAWAYTAGTFTSGDIAAVDAVLAAYL